MLVFRIVGISLKYKLFDNFFISSFQFYYEPGIKQTNIAATGYNSSAFSPMLNVGKGWQKVYFYTYGSYMFRSNSWPDYYSFGIETGYKIFSMMYLVGYSDFLKSKTTSPYDITDANEYGLYSKGAEYFSWGTKLIFEKERNNKSIGTVLNIAGSFTGHLVAHSPFISLGIYYKTF